MHQIEKRSAKDTIYTVYRGALRPAKKRLYLGSRIAENGNSIQWCDCNTYATEEDPCCPLCPPDTNTGGGGHFEKRAAGNGPGLCR